MIKLSGSNNALALLFSDSRSITSNTLYTLTNPTGKQVLEVKLLNASVPGVYGTPRLVSHPDYWYEQSANRHNGWFWSVGPSSPYADVKVQTWDLAYAMGGGPNYTVTFHCFGV